jgi:hypothetical protein
MPRIKISKEGFPKNLTALDAATGWGSRTSGYDYFTREELLHAAWTSGHEQAFFLQQPGPEGMQQYCQWKRSAVEMSIRVYDHWGTWRWAATDMLSAMDPSERHGASYHLGLMMTTAWARRALNIPWLLHLDIYRRQYRVRMSEDDSLSRPDLIGMDLAEQWSVFECKGRKWRPSTKDKKDAKKQVMRVQSVANTNPLHRLAVFAHFGTRHTGPNDPSFLETLVIDPDGDPKHPEPLRFDRIDRNKFLMLYYKPWMTLFEGAEEIDSQGLVWVTIRGAGVQFGMYEGLLKSLRSGEAEMIDETLNQFHETSGRLEEQYGYWAGDGMIVRAVSGGKNSIST